MRIANWQTYQGYKKRGPEWIKLHLSLLDQPQYLALPTVARAILPALWLTAARVGEEGELPDDLALLAVLSHQRAEELEQALYPLVSAGFLISDKPVARPATNMSGEQSRERAEREQSRIAVAARPRVEPAGSWSKEAMDDWIARYQGEPPRAIVKALKPLIDRHGWERVRPAWLSYLKQTEGPYASPARFAATFGSWAPPKAVARQGAPARPIPEPSTEGVVAWNLLSAELKQEVAPHGWATWIRPVDGLTLKDGVLTVAVPSEQWLEQIAGVLKPKIEAAAQRAGLGGGLRVVPLVKPQESELHDGSIR